MICGIGPCALSGNNIRGESGIATTGREGSGRGNNELYTAARFRLSVTVGDHEGYGAIGTCLEWP